VALKTHSKYTLWPDFPEPKNGLCKDLVYKIFGSNLDISAIVRFNNKLGEQWAEMPGVDGLCHDKVGPFLN
jgi:hypothetical protein